MSFGFSVGDFLATLELARRIRKQFVQAPEQFQAISIEIRSLSIVLQDAEVRSDSLSQEQTDRLHIMLGDCQALLSELETTLNKYADLEKPTKGRAFKRFLKRLQWEPDDIRDLRCRITAQISMLNTLETQAIVSSIAKLGIRQEIEANTAILEWISPVDYIAQHNDYESRGESGSRKWLFESSEYMQWVGKKGGVLLCPGTPGAGKTITTAMITKDLQTLIGNDKDKRLVNVYFTYQRQEQEIDEVLCSFLRASLERGARIPVEISQAFETNRSQRKSFDRGKVIDFLAISLSGLSRAYVLVDALDELETHVMSKFLQALVKLYDKCEFNLLLTTRHYVDVQPYVRDIGATSIEIRASDYDVRLYLSRNLFQLPGFVATDSALQNDIIEKISDASSGMFLLAELHLKCLKSKTTRKALRVSLRHLATGHTAYDKAYEKAMDMIESQSLDWKQLAKQAVLIVTCARRPLAVEELTYALSLDDSDAIDIDNVPDINDVVAACSGLITVDEEQGVVRLMHKSTQEYLDARKSSLFPDAAAFMAYTCNRFLNLAAASTDPPNSRVAPLPFTKYAKTYWAYHTHKAETEREKSCPETELPGNKLSDTVPLAASFIEAASNLGLIQMVRELPDIESKILEACRHGNCGLVDVILRVHNYDLNPPARCPGVPQSFTKRETPGRYILDKDCQRSYGVNLEVDDDVLLTIAAASGDLSMVELLLASGANPNIMSSCGKTALYIAAENNFHKIVSLLLCLDTIDPDFVSAHVEVERPWQLKLSPLTALSIAAKLGHFESLRVFAERSNLNFASPAGRTPLFFATAGGHVDCIAELLRLPVHNGLDVDFAGPDNYTPLMAAIANKDIEATKILLTRADITKPHGPTGNYPIHFAVTSPSPALIRVLLAVDSIEPDVLDDKGRSAFRLAAELGHSEVMEELGKDSSVQLSLPCAEGRSAYDMICRGLFGDVGVFRALQSLDPVRINADATSSKLSLLHRACSMLPEPAFTSMSAGRSTFHVAGSKEVGVAGLIKALLDLPTIDINLRDPEGNTPLMLAIRSCQVDTVRILLQHKDILPNTGFEAGHCGDPELETSSVLLMASSALKTIPGFSSESWFTYSPVDDAALWEKYYSFQNEILNLQLDCPKVFTGHTNSKGWTALHVAAASGTGDMIRSLLDKTSLSTHLNKRPPDGRSVLSLAMRNKKVDRETVELLRSVSSLAMDNTKVDEETVEPLRASTERRVERSDSVLTRLLKRMKE